MAKKGFEDRGQGLGRREVLECMVWAGTGVLWTVSGGVPHSVGLIGDALAAEPTGFTFAAFMCAAFLTPRQRTSTSYPLGKSYN